MKRRIHKFGAFRSRVAEYEDLHSQRKLCSLVVIACFFFCNWAVQRAGAEDSVTIADSSFLRISVDARGAAMGDAQGALTQDVYAMYWNPAGLSKIFFKEVGLTYQRIFQDMDYSFLGYAVPTDSYGTLAGQIVFLSSGSITSTYENPDGSFAGTGESFSVADLGLGISQSKAITKDLSYGVSVKLLSHKIMDQKAFSLAADVGFMYQTLIEEVRIGVALQNFSTSYKFLNQKLREPWDIKFATLYVLSGQPLFLAADYDLVSGQSDTLNLGAEYWFFDLMALRAGFKLLGPGGLLTRFNIGFGVSLRDIYQMDYSFSPHSELGISQRFSVIVRF